MADIASATGRRNLQTQIFGLHAISFSCDKKGQHHLRTVLNA